MSATAPLVPDAAPACFEDVRAHVAQGMDEVDRLIRRRLGSEVLLVNQAVASNIREGKTHQINGLIQQGRSQGMIAMDDSLKALVEAGTIEPHAALEKAIDKDEMRKWLKDRGDAVPEATD